MSRMNYEKIYFLGVDMNSSEYFWTHNSRYKNVNIPDIIMSCKPDERDPKSNHPTVKLKSFISEFGSTQNIEMINLSKNSLLAESMNTISLDELDNV